MEPNCLLCYEIGTLFHENQDGLYYKCPNCCGIFVPRDFLPTPNLEIDRYTEHNNDVEDPGYQKFVSPIVNEVLKDFEAEKHTGLDFGAGTGPVITKLLKEKGFETYPYDPFFKNEKSLLERKYDFIVCCEVMEHFHNPKEEFFKLKNLLIHGGKLYCMTHLYEPQIEFANWYYKNDPTHVFIYQKETIQYISNEFGFRKNEINKRLIVFSV